MISGKLCWVVRCEVCGKPAGKYRWTKEEAAADAKTAPGWVAHFCPECKDKPCERSGPLQLPGGRLNNYAGD